MKYRNKITEVDGIKFHSKAEATRYQELKLLERAGEIKYLELQPRFELCVMDEKICTYVGDFQYFDKEGCFILEDVKGVKTPAYNIKKKLMKAVCGITITEIGGSRRGTKRRKATK